jgi:protein TonB
VIRVRQSTRREDDIRTPRRAPRDRIAHVEVPMPQELLRDVLRTGDAPARARRRLSVLPISIAAHAVALAAFVIMPIAASIEPPPIASPFSPEYIPTVPPPSPPPPPRTPDAPRSSTAAPLAAPDRISPEIVHSSATDTGVPGVPDGFEATPGLGDIGPIGRVVVAPPPPPPPVQKPVRIGYGIREPKRIVNVTPEYPEVARRAGVQGVVILEAVLDVSGRVQSVRVLRSTPLLDSAAIKAVQQWRYTPTELNGVPVPVLMTITVQFTLAR